MKPILYLDCETEGPGEPSPVTDRIVSLGATDGELNHFYCEVFPGATFFPLQRSGIHGITADELEDAKPMRELAPLIHTCIAEHEVIVTYGGTNYDIPLLWEEFYRHGITWDTSRHVFLDLLNLWRVMEPRTLEDAATRFTLRKLSGAHHALHDAAICPGILGGMIEQWREKIERLTEKPFPSLLHKLADISAPTVEIDGWECERADLAGLLAHNRDGDLVYATKKNRGIAVIAERGYGWWLIGQDWVSSQTRAMIEAAFEKEDAFLREEEDE